MPAIYIREEEFPKDQAEFDAATTCSASAKSEEYFTREELLHAAFTSGHEQSFFEQYHGADAMHHYCQWKRSAVEMSIREVDDGGVTRWGATEMLAAMDPSERQGASYHLGIMMTTAWARRKLQMGCLLHLDLYRDEKDVIMVDEQCRSRPDLIGQGGAEDWSVFESKGRKSSPSFKDKKEAKTQAMRVLSIDKHTEIGRFAVFAYFGPEPNDPNGRCFLHALVIDPPGDANHPTPFKWDFINQSNFLHRYYRPWMSLFDPNASADPDGMIWVPLTDAINPATKY